MPQVRRKRATLREVAEYAGVSTATVSLVVNGKADDAGITGPTKQLVLEAIEHLQYAPNRMASAVVTGRSRMVGVVSALSRELFETQFGTRVLNGFVRGARQLGYHFVFLEDIASAGLESCGRTLQDAHEMCLEGLIVLIDIGREERIPHPDQWLSASIPVVTVQFTFDPEGGPGFRVDHRHAVQALTQHMVALGHKRIGFGARHIDLRRSQSIISLIDQELRQHGLRFEADLAFDIPRWDLMNGFVERVRTARPTALFTLYDGEGVRAISALQKAGYRIPDDISLIGYGDFPLAADVFPALTSYRPPLELLGEESMKYLIQCIEGQLEPDRGLLQEFVGNLVMRDSTAPAAR
jgi:LacI family transcriptional regulator